LSLSNPLKSHLFSSAYHVYSHPHALRFDLRLLALYKYLIDIDIYDLDDDLDDDLDLK